MLIADVLILVNYACSQMSNQKHWRRQSVRTKLYTRSISIGHVNWSPLQLYSTVRWCCWCWELLLIRQWYFFLCCKWTAIYRESFANNITLLGLKSWRSAVCIICTSTGPRLNGPTKSVRITNQKAKSNCNIFKSLTT